MWVESVLQKGSTFHFIVPFHPTPNTQTTFITKPQPQLTNVRLLIVDDNPTNRRILTLQTSKWGMIPRAASSGAQALEWLQKGETFDLAILDMQMPEMDGLMLASQIRKTPTVASLPLVLLTSMGIRQDNQELAGLSFASCLTKPIKPAQLHEVLSRVVSGTKPLARKAPVSKLDPSMAARLPLRILLCDDNLINQKVAARLLLQMGYKAEIANNGLECIQIIEQKPFDLIFMDVQMPEMDGLEATRTIRAYQKNPSQKGHFKPNIAIVAMTANAMQGDREKCLDSGMDDYLAKPIRPEDMRVIVERWGSKVSCDEPAYGHTSAQDIPLKNSTSALGNFQQPEIPPVDMERVMDFANGDRENLKELVELYITQTASQLVELRAAIQKPDAAATRRMAHSCAGASSTCGMPGISKILKEIERQGEEGMEPNISKLMDDTDREFERIRVFLRAYLDSVPVASQLTTVQP
jgi:CheY-like chemotaxis protein